MVLPTNRPIPYNLLRGTSTQNPQSRGPRGHVMHNNNTWAGGGEIAYPRCLRRLLREGGVGARVLSSRLCRYTNCSRPVKIGKLKYLFRSHRSADSHSRSPPLRGRRWRGRRRGILLHETPILVFSQHSTPVQQTANPKLATR